MVSQCKKNKSKIVLTFDLKLRYILNISSKVCQLLILNVSTKKRHLCAGVTLASSGEYDIGMILPQPILETQMRVVLLLF